MKVDKIKYLTLFLLAVFFASTNELSAKEAEQNFSFESHIFLPANNLNLTISLDKHNSNGTKVFTSYIFASCSDLSNNYYNLLFVKQLKFIPQSPPEDICLLNSVFLI